MKNKLFFEVKTNIQNVVVPFLEEFEESQFQDFRKARGLCDLQDIEYWINGPILRYFW